MNDFFSTLLKDDDILLICDFSDQNHGLIFSEMLVPNLTHFTFTLEHFFMFSICFLGVKKRGFNADRWPVFKWSFDDKYFARMSEGALSIYETSTFRLLDNKSIKVAGMRDFTWSPSENILAYWVAEDKDVPARVTLLEIPSRNEVRVKNLFNVADCKMHWQKTGDYLCVKVS